MKEPKITAPAQEIVLDPSLAILGYQMAKNSSSTIKVLVLYQD